MGVTKPSKTGKVCAGCGSPQEQWSSQTGHENKYCCEGCGTGSGCTCSEEGTSRTAKASMGRQPARRDPDDTE